MQTVRGRTLRRRIRKKVRPLRPAAGPDPSGKPSAVEEIGCERWSSLSGGWQKSVQRGMRSGRAECGHLGQKGEKVVELPTSIQRRNRVVNHHRPIPFEYAGQAPGTVRTLTAAKGTGQSKNRAKCVPDATAAPRSSWPPPLRQR